MKLTAEQVEQLNKREKLAEVFTPASPVSQLELFAGRIPQVFQIADAVNQQGQHVAIYGERGVGKTSMANILGAFLGLRGGFRPFTVVKINCGSYDKFASLWKKVFEQIAIEVKQPLAGFSRAPGTTVATLANELPDKLSPDDVRRGLGMLAGPNVVILDEFDRIEFSQTRRMMADTIKAVSDYAVSTTIIVVGVADTVDQLIENHASIGRVLVQVYIPRMSQSELIEIVDKRLKEVGMDIESDAKEYVAQLCQGLPHYAHVLGQISALTALHNQRLTVSRDDVEAAISEALQRVQASISSLYHTAISSTRKENLYRQVLLACALADVDNLSFFPPSNVRGPMSQIMRKPYGIAAFSRHLHALCERERGEVLQKRGSPRKFLFRFRDPLMQPYVVMRGLTDGMIAEDLLRQLGRV